MRFVSVRRLLPVPAGLTGQGAWLVQIHPPGRPCRRSMRVPRRKTTRSLTG